MWSSVGRQAPVSHLHVLPVVTEVALASVTQAPQTATKHLFVSGGVVSSLGKGLTAPAWAVADRARPAGLMQKLDPYLNVDPGTMNPFQHGEVFVTEDGAETASTSGTTSGFSTGTCPARRM